MNAQTRPVSGSFAPSPLLMSTEVVSPSPLRHSTASSNIPAYTPDRHSSSDRYSSPIHISNLSERLHNVDFDSPAKIFQNKHAIHQFENVTPDIAGHESPSYVGHAKFQYDSDVEAAESQSHTSRSMSPEIADRDNHRQNGSEKPSPPATAPQSDIVSVSQLETSHISRVSTPSQFVFKKPEYDSHYHHTHFHHLDKKDTIFHDLKRIFKKNQDKKKKKLLVDDESSVRSSGSSVYSKQSDLSFANEFNKNLESRYGKWG